MRSAYLRPRIFSKVLTHRGDIIGRVIILELQEQDSKAFEAILDILQSHSEIEKYELYQAAPNAPFTIRSVREVGYCFEVQAEK